MELGHRTVKSGQFGVIWEAERQPKSTGCPPRALVWQLPAGVDTCRMPPSSPWGKKISGD